MEIASHKTEGIPNPYGFESLRSRLSQTMRCSDCFYDGMYSGRIVKTFAFRSHCYDQKPMYCRNNEFAFQKQYFHG